MTAGMARWKDSYFIEASDRLKSYTLINIDTYVIVYKSYFQFLFLMRKYHCKFNLLSHKYTNKLYTHFWDLLIYNVFIIGLSIPKASVYLLNTLNAGCQLVRYYVCFVFSQSVVSFNLSKSKREGLHFYLNMWTVYLAKYCSVCLGTGGQAAHVKVAFNLQSASCLAQSLGHEAAEWQRYSDLLSIPQFLRGSQSCGE